jgi:hypothetical protein
MRKTHAVPDRYAEHPLWLRILIPLLSVAIIIVAVLLPVLLASNTTMLTADVRSRYTAGTIAETDVKATETFHYVDEGETRRRQQVATQAIIPRFRISLVSSREMLSDAESLLSGIQAVRVPISPNLEQSLQNLSEENLHKVGLLVRELLEEYISQGIFDEEDIIAMRSQGYREIQVERREIIGATDIEQIVETQDMLHTGNIANRMHADLIVVGQGLEDRLLPIVFDTLRSLIRPNVQYDPVATALAREEAALEVPPVVVRVEEGEYIIKRDFVITQDDIKTLQAMQLAAVHYAPSQLIGRAFFVVILTLSAMYALYLVFYHSKRRYQFLFIFLVGVLITQISTYVVILNSAGRSFISLDQFLPVFFLPIFMALVTNRKRAGMIAAVLLGSYAMLLPRSTQSTVFFVIAVSFFGIYFIKYVSRRIDMVFQWFFGIVASAFVVLFNNLLNGYGFSQILASIFAISVNISGTYILVTFLLPLVEVAFNLPTPFRLRELAYSDSPALVRLSQTAVGTYNHSLIVSEMAYAAAKEIQADPLLSRVAGLYHDIGKQEHPEYFIENQHGGNKHDELKASLSVAIIKSHVKIGVEKGREARLPQEVLDIISQHHGNDVIAIFLKEAQLAAQNEKDRRQVKRQDYAYANQIPQSPEAAIVMLADSVEAASRTVKKPSAQKYEKLVNQIIMGKIERKQLGASRISLTDLETIARVFVQILTGKFHTRIEYPEDEPKKDQT